MLLSGLQMLVLLTKKATWHYHGLFTVATAAQIESPPRADHKEQWKAKLRFLFTLLLEEKNENEGGS